ncbi:MAG: hypothetical protein WC791_00125 [Candidatus Paceibacterota bacterium]|jgi:hypothetical protein
MEDIGPNKKEGTPFLGILKESKVSGYSGEKGKLNKLAEAPGKIIRAEKFSELNEIYQNRFGILELAQIAKKLYQELEESYGILVPADFIVGKNEEGEEIIYSVVDKIEGQNFFGVKNNQEIAEKVEAHYATLAKYLLDKSISGGFYLDDIYGPEQYVYGHTAEAQQNEIYLVDTDIFITDRKAFVYRDFSLLAKYIAGREKYFNSEFNDARRYIAEFASKPLMPGLTDGELQSVRWNLEEIKKFLNNENLDTVPSSAITSFE